jgi:hypothetical protein
VAADEPLNAALTTLGLVVDIIAALGSNRYGIMLPCPSSVIRNPVTPARDETANLSSSS